MKPHNKILLQPPKKSIPLWVKWSLAIACTLFGLWWLYYFMDQNDLVYQPYFPSTLSMYVHHGIAWLSAISVFMVFIVIFLSASYEWLLHYRRQKIIQFSLGSFLVVSGFGLALFFASITKTMVYSACHAMASQWALYVGTPITKQSMLHARQTVNSSYQQHIQLKRGKVMVWIIDPVSYTLNLQLHFDQKTYQLDPFCYSGSKGAPRLHTSQFKMSGIESFLGFRCTSGCELYSYFTTSDLTALVASNFNTCRKIYSQQPSLK
ncbi:hypothetical protein [Acinetobacter variabilis]|uniref:hypothetical protein n=1 Tax=Acinetobacter variabilis TaxID=70346 RepID=UPI003AF4D1E4